jgi:putative transposase
VNAYKTEILLNETQVHKLINTIEVCRYLYNAFISYNKQLYEKESKFCSGMDFDKYVNNELSIENPWIKQVSSKARHIITQVRLRKNCANTRCKNNKL